MGIRRSQVVAALTLVILAVTGPQAEAETAIPTTTRITAIASTVIPRMQTFPPVWVTAGTYRGEEYLLVENEVSGSRDLVRLRDGVIVRRLGAEDSALRLSATAMIGAQSDTSITFEDPLTGKELVTHTVGEGESRIAADLGWQLVRTGDDLVLQRAGAPDLTVRVSVGAIPPGSPPVMIIDARTLLVQAAAGWFWLDVTTGSTRPLGTLGGVGVRLYPTRDRVFAVEEQRDGRARVTWRDRADDALNSVDVVSPLVDSTSWWFARGDRLTRGSLESRERVVDLTTGDLAEPLVADPYERAQAVVGLAGGYVVLSADGALAVPEEGANRVVWRAPARNVFASALVAGNSWLGVNPWDGRHAAYTELPSGTAWRQGGPQDPLPGFLVGASGDTTLSRLRFTGAVGYAVTWPGGSRLITETFPYMPLLRQGGRFLTGDGGKTHQDAVTGNPVTLPAAEGAFDGAHYWWLPSGGRPGDLAVRDLTDPAARTRVVRSDATCGTGVAAVWGRWVGVHCPDPEWAAGSIAVVDTLGVVPTRTVRRAAAFSSLYPPLLGDGFLVIQRAAPGSYGWWAAIDLATGRETPLATCITCVMQSRIGSPGRLTVTRDRVMFLDTSGQVRWVPRSAVATDVGTGTPDVTAPTATVTLPTASVLGTSPVTVAWTAADPPGSAGERRTFVDSVDAEYRVDSGAWIAPASWQRLTASSLTWAIGSASRACVRVRARDVAGNVGAWSAERCWRVDTTAPVPTLSSVGARVVQAVSNSWVTYRYGARDDIGVSLYDVQVRQAARSKPLSAWTSPPAFSGRTATSLQAMVPAGGEICLRTRGRDVVGRVGAWSAGACATVPLDDRALVVAKGRVDRAINTYGLGGTLSVLQTQGAEVRSGPHTGTAVAVEVLRGPGQGAVDVFVGTARVGRISLASPTWRRDVYVLKGQPFTNATVRIVLAGTSQGRVDALGILRG